ncbi:MAG: hypothetical protein JEZ03_03935 [Bacteroidales bacterium]|nr:hypothetical protein [Bacteroidales bacterium]
MKTKTEFYYSKILLFGEYSVIYNSMGLSIPYTHFRGGLSSMHNEKYTDLDYAQDSNKSLKEYLIYLHQLQSSGELIFKMNLNALENDLNNGLYFESSIPQGYGLGSSGALVCSLYSKYAIDKIRSSRNLSSAQLLKLKRIFAQMESYFHGKSSGLDPLNCYIQYPLLIRGENEISVVGIPRKNNGGSGIFLLNTNQIGKTEPLVNHFLERCENPDYKKRIEEELIPLNDLCIENTLDGNAEHLFENLVKLSRFEFDYLKPMIPNDSRAIWQHGLDTGLFTLKLCGSGGGGFLLGFTKDYTLARHELLKLKQEVITVYKNPVE